MAAGNESGAPSWLLPDRAYDVLKWVGLIVCPAVATFVLTVGQTWGMPHVSEVAATVTAVGTLVGALVGVSQLRGPSGGGSDE